MSGSASGRDGGRDGGWDGGRASGAWVCRAAILLARHPVLWPTAVRQVLLLAVPGWWRTRPYLPLPAPDYLRFRLHTAYGDQRAPRPADVVTYLHWCRAWPALTDPLGRP